MTNTDSDFLALSNVKFLMGIPKNGHNSSIVMDLLLKEGIQPAVSMKHPRGIMHLYRREDVLPVAAKVREAFAILEAKRKEETKKKYVENGRQAQKVASVNKTEMLGKLDQIIERLDRLEAMWKGA